MPSSEEVEDTELLTRWRAGDDAAGNQLFERHFDAIYRFFCRKLDDEQALDLLQKTFLACVNGRDRVKAGNQFRPYLYGAARNILLRHYRDKYRQKDGHKLDDRPIAGSQMSPTMRLAKKAEHRLLLKALCNLDLNDQLLLELRYWERLTRKQLAQVFEIGDLAVASRISRAKRRLRTEIERVARDPDLGTRTTANFEGWLDDLREQAPGILRDPAGR